MSLVITILRVWLEVIIKLGKQNMGPNQLCHIPLGEVGGCLDEALPVERLFKMGAIIDQFVEIVA